MIKSLQAGRGIAALAVLLHHAAQTQIDSGSTIPGLALFLPGSLGVDFFFVLSGFIICHSTLGRDKTPRSYALARFRRVFLPYLPAGLAFALLLLVVPSAHHWSWLPTLTLLPFGGAPALPPAWTLQHEMLFYFVFGFFYFAGLLPLGLAAWLIAILLGPDILAFKGINLEFFFGIAACLLYRRGKAHPLLMLLAIPALWAEAHYGARIFVGLAAAFLMAPLAQLEKSRGLPVPDLLILLGAASYSIYLIHYPVIAAMNRLGLNFAPLTACAGLGAGLAYYFLVERRVIRARDNPEVVLADRGIEAA
jgi:exopolysaccharide production protein ExoZ